jgi:hypothetical protein
MDEQEVACMSAMLADMDGLSWVMCGLTTGKGWVGRRCVIRGCHGCLRVRSIIAMMCADELLMI